MRIRQISRWLLLALAFSVIPASSYAGVFISVGFAPPVLPVYVQPPCPQPGWMWTPGYWAYGDDGYYWVPGAWVPAPYVGALWTPPYWGWDGGLYVFHPGYWGPHVGYYGGVNYGFGYLGVGFVGGMWRGHDFYYNRAAWRVDDHRIHDYYDDRRDWDHYRVAGDSRVSYSGGPGGIRHEPDQRERLAMRDHHQAATQMQMQHMQAARTERASYFNNNHGHPENPAVARPWNNLNRPSAINQRPNTFNNRGNYPNQNNGFQNRQPNQGYQGRGYGQPNNNYQGRNNPQWQRPNYQVPNNRGADQRPQQQWQNRQAQNQQWQNRQAQNQQWQNRQAQNQGWQNQQRQNQQRNDQRGQQRPQNRPQDRPQDHSGQGARHYR